MDHFDAIIVGSGFGGTVSALRLAEKGYRVLVIEKGRRFAAEDFPKTNWDLRRWMWTPAARAARLLPDVVLRARDDPARRRRGRRLARLREHAAGAERELLQGVVVGAPRRLARGARTALRHRASACWARRRTRTRRAAIACSARSRATSAAPSIIIRPTSRCTSAQPGKTVPDPYFGGAGPARTGCIQCGACMTGCRYGAKNTLDLNYLYLAERRGATVRAETEVTAVRPRPGGGRGYRWRRAARSLTTPERRGERAIA